ncbi:CubicO group peptidase, beta-lactamase class C family [Gracilibacillus ureilyticus]|uniref:CubicO group peptidase, beta-lactamase class C family n=1 Tax=Gracilibacillus ureilyticus TaxID=531814 RepID=A0A1H9W5D1_9BACI|nr:serine hydrolase domain-containing protein [Gracilibacillus ureilyticus]SES28673.1 CubicO group peptidase, beta-lactamase class C family [Gracilibacillus ureilyticus]
MTTAIAPSFMEEVVSNAVSKKNIFGAVLCVEKGDNSLSLINGAGNLTEDRSYFIASVTKLYVTAVLLKLRSENCLQLHDNISKYLSGNILHELHHYKGFDYSKHITIKQLMSNTSGIPDYFTSDAISELTAGNDQKWGFEKVMASAKMKKPKFAPGKKVQYSDTNFQLLGKIIETITEQDIHTVFRQFIFDELKLVDTYLYEDVNDTRPATMFYKEKELHLPKYMSSIGPEGGIVSTAKESMIFLKAFKNGHFFPKKYFDELKEWKVLFSPGLFFYGVGIANQPISLKELKNGLIGHWGQTGAFSFYHPKTDLYFTGTVNQFFGQSVAARMMLKIIKNV